MMRWWPVMVVYIIVLCLNACYASPAVPNFPTIDDAGAFNPTDDDLADVELNAPIQITHMRVRSEIALRYARTAVITKVYNPNKKPQEATFSIILPDTAFITGFTMTLGNETYDAYVKEKEKAKEIYDKAVSQGKTAAHVATEARDSNHFTIKFNVEGKTSATYRLRYEEFLVRRNGVYNHAINLHPGALVTKMDVIVHIKESQKITKLRVPELRTGNEIDATDRDAENKKAVIQRGKSMREATVLFKPDLTEQERLAEVYAEKTKKSTRTDPDASNIGYDSAELTDIEGLLGQFVIQYDVQQPKNGEILVNDGYFVHFFAPSSLPPLSKQVVFVLDTSGSMVGTKLTQMKEAMYAILSDLRPTDYMSVVELNTEVKVLDIRSPQEIQYNPYQSLVSVIASPQNIKNAKAIVSSLKAVGGTYINRALEVAVDIVQAGIPEEIVTNALLRRAELNTKSNTVQVEPMIIFLTDGEPTIGETRTEIIIPHITNRNTGKNRATIYSLAFGEDADRGFLRKLSLNNNGFMRQIYEGADAALQLQGFYRQVASPLLSDVNFLYPRDQIKEGSVSQSQFATINDGSEVAIVGEVSEGTQKLTPEIVALRSAGDGRSRERFEATPEPTMISSKDKQLPLERLWAYLTIKQLLDKRDSGYKNDSSSEESPEQKALSIALKYSFVTPLTSLVVVRLNTTDNVEPVDAEEVDLPNILPYIRPDSSSNRLPVFSSIISGSGLTVGSSKGLILFIQSNKRLVEGDKNRGHIAIQRLNPVNFNAATTSAPTQDWSGLVRAATVFYNGPQNSSAENQTIASIQTPATTPIPASSPITAPTLTPVPTAKRPTASATTLPTTTAVNNDLETVYHLQGYKWALNVFNASEEALMFWVNGLQVTLKVSTNNEPPRVSEGDLDCYTDPKVSAVPSARLLCVYITRCSIARSITLDDYQNSYCYVNDRYAGICCPSNNVDISLNV